MTWQSAGVDWDQNASATYKNPKIFLRIKKNVYPVHKPVAVDDIILNFGDFLTINNFVWRAFIKESSHLCFKKK
jgi:hypothetical protein